jgi:uncharacterized protein (TIGR00266 family)
MEFTIVGEGDPFLHVNLKQGEKIQCESNSMVMMEGNLDLKGEIRGGLLSGLARKLANDESFFTQKIEAVRGSGDTLLSPELPGDLQILECGVKQYILNDGCFLAAEDTIDLKMKTQGIGQALFGGSGGFIVTQTSGYGKVVVSGLGTMFKIDVTPNNPITVDNFHAVAWDNTLKYELSVSTKKGGLLGNIVNSLTSGEGVVTKFSGTGSVYICSRNRGAFVSWLASQINPPR